MPADMTRYPANWQEIRESILLRAGGDESDPRIGAVCEWCRIRNYDLVNRESSIELNWGSFDSYALARAHQKKISPTSAVSISLIVLTIAHVDDPNPMNCDPLNLAALCQRCHNRHDAEMRRRNAAKTKRRNAIDAGQLSLF